MQKFKYALIILTSLYFMGCASSKVHQVGKVKIDPIYHAVALIHPVSGQKANGIVEFTESFGEVKVDAYIKGLEPNAEHIFQIHNFGDCRAVKATSAGEVFNPDGPVKRGRDEFPRGRLGVLKANKKGNAKFSGSIKGISINGAVYPVIGRGILIFEGNAELPDHPDTDTLGCGVIGAIRK
jgi:Cu-Zn family superoxide dismutase